MVWVDAETSVRGLLAGGYIGPSSPIEVNIGISSLLQHLVMQQNLEI